MQLSLNLDNKLIFRCRGISFNIAKYRMQPIDMAIVKAFDNNAFYHTLT